MNWIFSILRWTWELPQTILGLFVFLYVIIFRKIDEPLSYENGSLIIPTSFGVSLGFFIFTISEKTYQKYQWGGLSKAQAQLTKLHEIGHGIQSRILGPLYLLVVGIPSFIGNILTRLRILNIKNYYKRFPENWADSLVGIERNFY